MQLDQAEKGFSFTKEGPLDMRMDPTLKLTAEEIVNRWSEKELGEIFRDLGEEPKWRLAAKAVVEARKKKRITTTKELVDVLLSSIGRSRRKLHPATLIFQALRICVNRELDVLGEGLIKAINVLSQGGKIGVISFHSLEDRIVKNVFRDAAHKSAKGPLPALKLLTKKPLTPSYTEVRLNPRSRSAKMRFAEKT